MLEHLNWIAILISCVASMAVGAGWYTILAKPWMEANQFTQDQRDSIEANDTPSIYLIALVCHFIMSIVLSGVLFHAAGQNADMSAGILTALLIWLGFVVTSMSVNHRFQMKTWSLTIIDAGHYLLVLLAQGAIIGWFGF